MVEPATGNSRPEKLDPVVVAKIPRSTQARRSFRVIEQQVFGTLHV